MPENVLDIIRKNLESGISAVDNLKWGSHFLKKNERAYFFADFNSKTGEMNVIADENTPIENDLVIRIQFIYQSIIEVIFNRKKLVEDLESKGISIRAAQILMIMEKLFSKCHKFTCWVEEVENNKTSEYSGTLDKNELQKLLNDKTSKKITKLWNSIHDPKIYPTMFDTDFLIDMLYVPNFSDKFWKSTWVKKDLEIGEILVIERSDQSKRYCKVILPDVSQEKKQEENLWVLVSKEPVKRYELEPKEKLKNYFKVRW